MAVPDEVWVSIFAYLTNANDKLCVLRVCQTWRRVGLDHGLWNEHVPLTIKQLFLLGHACRPGYPLSVSYRGKFDSVHQGVNQAMKRGFLRNLSHVLTRLHFNHNPMDTQIEPAVIRTYAGYLTSNRLTHLTVDGEANAKREILLLNDVHDLWPNVITVDWRREACHNDIDLAPLLTCRRLNHVVIKGRWTLNPNVVRLMPCSRIVTWRVDYSRIGTTDIDPGEYTNHYFRGDLWEWMIDILPSLQHITMMGIVRHGFMKPFDALPLPETDEKQVSFDMGNKELVIRLCAKSHRGFYVSYAMQRKSSIAS